MSKANQRVIRRIVEEVWNQGNLDAIHDLFAEEWIYHNPGEPAESPGIAGIKRLARAHLAAFPDLHVEIHDMFSDGDRVATRWTARATHLGDLPGLPATGERVVITGINIDRIAGGRAVEQWVKEDTLADLHLKGGLRDEWG